MFCGKEVKSCQGEGCVFEVRGVVLVFSGCCLYGAEGDGDGD